MFGRAGVDGAGGAGAGFEGFGGFSDIFDAFFGGGAGTATARRGRPQPGADLRYDLRITFEEAIKGTEKEIEFRVLQPCETCGGNGANPGPSRPPARCDGRGEIRNVRQTMLGQMVNVSACPRCKGEGKIVETPCHTCKGDGRIEKKRTLRVTIPAGIDEGHQIRLSNEGETGPRGGSPGSLYVAVHVAPHPTLIRRGHRAHVRGQDLHRPGGARDEDQGARRSMATRRSRSRRAPSPAPRSASAARVCPTCGARGRVATSTSWSTSSFPPS